MALFEKRSSSVMFKRETHVHKVKQLAFTTRSLFYVYCLAAPRAGCKVRYSVGSANQADAHVRCNVSS
jgi:hypothetical protein